MLRLIYGIPGSGKTYLNDSMILNCLKKGKKVTLLVPEQEVMESERRIADRAEKEGVFCEKLNVVSFRRLADLAFRKYGGIEYQSLGDGGRLIVIWRIIEELAPALKAYQNNRDRALCELMLSVCTELKRYRVSIASLSRAADTLAGTSLGDKVYDISLIFAAYNAQLGDTYSDSIDEVEHLAQILKENNFLSDTELFADSFNGFTANELRVLEFAMLQTDLTVTLCRPEENGHMGAVTVEKTEKQLLKLAAKHGINCYPPVRLPSDSPYVPVIFKPIQEHLWDLTYFSDKGFSSDNVTLAYCRDRFFEAEFVAIKICELIRNGARYRDIAIISRNTEDLNGVFDVVFEKYGIPLFFSHRTPLITTPLYRAISGALEVIIGGFKTEDVISYIKCDCLGLDGAEINLLESYAALWGLSGRRWTDEYEWNMNPHGFSDRHLEEKSAVLEKINLLRLFIRDPLVKLRDSLRGNITVKDASEAIYNFIADSGCYKYICESKKSEDTTVYNTIISMLDTVVEVGADIPANARVMSEFLSMMAKKTDYGRIPQSFDCVLAGDAAILRASGREHIFLTSCENGVFPRALSDDSVFSDSDKAVLFESGIELSADTSERNDNEMFYFQRAALSAAKTLTASCILINKEPYPSPGFTRLHDLYPANKIIKYPDDFSEKDRIQSLSSALDIVRPNESSPIYSALRKIYEENGIHISYHRMPLSEAKCTVSKETTERLFSDKMNMTQRRFEDYAKCPFSYYSKYILTLTEQKHASFSPSELGSYIHRILEKVISFIFPPGGKKKDITDTELSDIILKETNEILNDTLGENFVSTGRISALISRLTRTVTLLIKNLLSEFEHSSFAPRFFEMNIGGTNSDIAPLTVKTDDGTQISVYGVVDRVDSFTKDGNAYIRVVDYKTGSSTHNLKNIVRGIDMQMFLYLFAICSSKSTGLRQELGISDSAKILPAGVMYHNSRIKVASENNVICAEDALRRAERSLVRSGVLLNDEAILDAMESGLEGNFIAVTKKKEKIAISGGELKSLEEFGKLQEQISAIMKEIGNKIKSGCADAAPIRLGTQTSCTYCKLKPFCRRTEKN